MIFNKKLFRESTYKILTVLFLIGYNFTPPILAANEILNLDVPVGTEIVQEIDHSEDILEEGISDPEWIAKGEELDEAIEEETPLDVPAQEEEDLLEGIVPNPLLTKPTPANILEELTYPTFVVDEKVATTTGNVEIGKTYIAPQNSKVRVFFTKLPENPSTLTIEEITLTQEEIEATGAVSDKAYDIKTDMVDGTFEYDLTLPSDEENTKVVYVENRAEIFTNIKEINSTVIDEGNTLKIEGLDHFTLFIPANGIVLSVSGSFNGVTQVTVAPSTVIEVDITVQRSENWENNDWESTSWSINGGSTWTCVNTPDNTIGQGTDTESFDITAPATIGTYSVSFRAHRDDNCGSTGVSNTFTLIDGIIVQNVGSANVCNNPSDSYSLSSSGGIWTSVNGGSNVNGQNTEEVKWGNSVGYGQSGLRFDSVGIQTFNENTKFLLGTLTHKNYPINNAANGATLQIKLSFSEPAIGDKTFSYYFGIEETPNSGNCPSWQKSSTDCDDKITFPNSYGSEVITINDIQYTLVIDGFVNSYTCGSVGSVLNYFITEERKDNAAYLVGHLSSQLIPAPAISIVKKTNNIDVTSEENAPELNVGDEVTWQYIVQNTGNVDLSNISVVDNKIIGTINCPASSLPASSNPSERVMTCTATGTVIAGQYENTATVKGTPPNNIEVSAEDTSWYFGVLKKGHIIVDKVTNPSGDEQSFNFTTTGTGYTGFSLTDGSTPNDQELVAGTYTVSEGSIQGWDSVSSCTSSINDTESAGNLELDPGETIKCIFTNTKLSINVEKTANPTSVPETGGDVEFTIKVKNTSAVAVNLTSLNDDKFGDLNNEGTCFVPQTISAGDSYECKFTKNISGEAETQHKNIVTATASGVTDTDDATVGFTDVAPTIEVTKTPSVTEIAETGGDVTFTFTVKNTSSKESVTITSLSDSVYGTLSGDADCQVGTVLSAGSSCEFSITRWVEGDSSGNAHKNVFTGKAKDNDGTEATDDDDATVGFTDVAPTIEVTKTPSVTEIAETGGNVIFTFTVKNTSSKESVTITSLSDSVYGTLSGDADCQVGTVLSAGSSCEFSITRWVEGDSSGNAHKNVFTGKAKDNDGTEATDDDDATVGFTDVRPLVTMEKSVTPSIHIEPGGTFTYTLKITNNSEEDVEITTLTDTNTLSSECLALIGVTITPGASKTCSYTVEHTTAGTYDNTAYVLVTDNDGSTASDDDSKTVKVIGARITFKDLTATNDINDPHIFTVKVEQNKGGGWIVYSGGLVSFSLVNNTAGASFVGGVDTCTTDVNGECDIQINSSSPGTVEVHAETTVDVLEQSINRQTDGTLGSSINAKKTYEAGKIIIKKETLPKGSTQEFEFNPSWSDSNFNLKDGGQKDSGWLVPGTYNISEINPDGWYLYSTSCISSKGHNENIQTISLQSNEIVTCTFTNYQKGSITVIKNDNIDSGQDFVFNFKPLGVPLPQFTLDDDDDPTLSNTRIFSDLKSTTYDIYESPVSGWTPLTVECLSDNQIPNDQNRFGQGRMTVELRPGENMICTFTNIRDTGSIKVNKYTDLNGDGDWSDSNEQSNLKANTLGFRWNIDGGSNNNMGSTVSGIFTGNHSVNEIIPSGYHFVSWYIKGTDKSCSNPNGRTLPIKLDVTKGKTKEITICNARDTGTVTIVKDAINNSKENFYFDSNFPSGDFELKDDGNIYNGGTPEKRTFTIPTGSYWVDERDESGWKLTGLSCVGDDNSITDLSTGKVEIDLDSNENVVCTYTNTQLAKVWGFKVNDENGDRDWDFGEWGLGNWRIFLDEGNGKYDGTEVSTLTSSFLLSLGYYEFTNLLPGTYSVCEQLKSSWSNTTPVCQTVDLTPGDTDGFINFFNIQYGKVGVHKYHDINGDGILDENEQGLGGWTMNLYKGSSCKGEAVSSGETDSSGNVVFKNIVPGKYSVNETLQSGWSTTTPVCQDIEVEPTETKNVNIGNVILTDIYGVKWNDINGNGKRDCEDDRDTCEPLLSGWTINLFKWNQEGEYSEPFKTTLTDSEEGKGYGFEDLLPGKYLVCEVQQEGWIQTYPLNQMDNCYEISLPTEVEPEYNFGNTKDPLLEIQKSNNKETIDQIPGDEVIYTIIVTAPKREITIDSLARGISQMAENDMTMGNYIIRDVVVSDIAPSGFKYISGSWTAVSTYRGDIKSSILEPEYDGKRSAHWGLGNMEEGEVITLTYKTQISSSTDSGLYPDIAWVKGKSVMDKPVLGNISTGASTPFVGTDVTVIEPMETEEGEVLGATTYLPNTGSKTYLTLASIIAMILGFVTLLLGSQKKYLKKLVLSFVFLFLILPSSIFAYDSLIVKIEQPKTPTGNQSFNIDFTAQDVNEGEITVDCYKNDILFYTTNGNSGVCPVTVESSGTYTFYVKATVGSSVAQSGSVTVVVKLEPPSPVVEYSKNNNILKFKTANDERTSMVEIFRSDKSSFIANSSTLIHTMSVVPNTEYTYTDTTAESGKQYFYAIRAVDSLGNVSTIVSDNEVIILPVSTGTTSVTVVANAQGQETATGSEEEGEVAGEKDIDVDGEVEGEKDENIDEEETTEKLTESIKNNWVFWVIGIVALGGIVYIYVQRTKKNK